MAIDNQKYLKSLSILNFIYGGIILLPILYEFYSILFGFLREFSLQKLYPTLKLIFPIILSSVSIKSGFLFEKPKNYWFSFSVAILQCFVGDIPGLSIGGRIIGAITIIILLQESVKDLYDRRSEL